MVDIGIVLKHLDANINSFIVNALRGVQTLVGAPRAPWRGRGERLSPPSCGAALGPLHCLGLSCHKYDFSSQIYNLKRYGPLVGAKVGCGPSGALQLLAVEW